MERELLDLAYVLRKQNASESAKPAATAEIRAQFPDAAGQEISDAFAKADDLIAAASEWADELRGPGNDGKGTPSFKLQDRCPGFSVGKYSDAESWGLYLTK